MMPFVFSYPIWIFLLSVAGIISESGEKLTKPFALAEAVLNTAITGGIFKYLNDKNDFSSVLVSEADVMKTGNKKRRCDIILPIIKSC